MAAAPLPVPVLDLSPPGGIDALFRPRSIAVVGASRGHGSVGRIVLERLLQGGFDGPVYPVNPHARSVASVRAWPSVADIPDDIDLVIVATPARTVLDIAGQSAAKGVKALLVLSAGFAETGPEGKALQDELLAKIRAAEMCMVGPNCFGLINTSAATSMNATFGPIPPIPGRVAMAAQSGALGLAMLDYARDLGLGFSMFASVGNKADISGNDLLAYWENDPETSLIMLYLESFGNPRKFARLARRVGRTKPVLALKSGRSQAGARAARSHTAALAGSERGADALFHQAGVLRAGTLEDLFDIGTLLVNQPLPAGRRTAVITNAGGPGILAADAAEAAGLVLPPLENVTLDMLREVLPPTAGLNNPIDMIASADERQYELTLRSVLADPGIDAVIVTFIPVGFASSDGVIKAIGRAQQAAQEIGTTAKPVLFCHMTSRPPISSGLPTYRFPESASRALGAVAAYAERRRRPEGRTLHPANVDHLAARTLIGSAAVTDTQSWLPPDQVQTLLASACIRIPNSEQVNKVESVEAAAARLQPPLAVKIVSSTILHKTDAGGVALDLASPTDAAAAAAEMRTRLGNQIEGFLVQEMAPPGTELLAGVVDDPDFGPLIGFGLGGVTAEVLGDVVFRITPLTDIDVQEMTHGIRALPLLEGYRGRPPADLAAVEDLLARLSWLVETVPEIVELDLNPVRVYAEGDGCLAVDARIAVRNHRTGPPAESRP